MASGLRLGLTLARGTMGLVPIAEPSAAEAASTFYRFFQSKHVVDLRLIFRAAFVLFVIFSLSVIFVGVFSAYETLDGQSSFGKNAVKFWHILLSNLAYLGPIVTVCGAAAAWAYQSASARLGVVDLFACEISTLCRVGTMFDVGKQYVEQYDTPPPEQRAGNETRPQGSSKFVSQEAYFPVFDNNARDLQVLEALVVSNITEFYTYMKATRDSQRKLAEIEPPQAAKPNMEKTDTKTRPDGPWHAAMSNVIYLLFLAYESGRKAVNDLIEFQPTAAERKIVILITELKCYSFLLSYFDHDNIRYQRLKLREEDYKHEVPQLYRRVMSHAGKEDEKDWLPAMRIAPELERRYNEALGEDI